MAQEKSMKLNKTRTDEFLKKLDEKPEGKTVFIMQAIIASLIVHIFVLFVTQMLTQDNRIAKEETVFVPLEMDMIEEEKIPEEIQQEPQEQRPRTGDLKNLIANENSERSSDQRSYRGMTKAQINEQVEKDLRQMEADEFARLNEGRPDITTPQKGGNSKDPYKASKENDWYKDKGKGNNKSYSGNVTAAFNMKGRDPLDNPTPTYRCKTQGQVVIKITIDITGKVTDAKVDDAKSSLDDCLRIESEKYARLWKFDYKSDGAKKQDGTITFTFSAQ